MNGVDHMDKSTRMRELVRERENTSRDRLYKCNVSTRKSQKFFFFCDTLFKQMPFIGRDWRANGDVWTKTEVGSWERPRRMSISTSVSLDLIEEIACVLIVAYLVDPIECKFIRYL